MPVGCDRIVRLRQHAEDSGSVQATAFWRCSPSDAQDRLVANIGGHLGEVDEDGVRERSPAYLSAASSELADRVGEKLGAAAEVPAE